MFPFGLNVNEESDRSEESKDNWVDVPLRRNSSSLKSRGRVNSVYGYAFCFSIFFLYILESLCHLFIYAWIVLL
jgi:hypothetical protein